MTFETPRTRFGSIVLPIFLNKLILLGVLFVDTLFLSRVSAEAVAGVSASLPVVYGCVAIIGTLASFTTSRIARAVGRGSEDDVKREFSAGLATCLALGALFMAAQIAVAPHLGRWLGLAEGAARACEDYVLGISAMSLVDGAFLTFTAFLYARGVPRGSIASSALLFACSIALNAGLLFGLVPGLDLSPFSIAVVTLVAHAPSIAMLARVMHRSGGFDVRRDLRFDRGTLENAKRILRDALPASLEPTSQNLMQIVVVSLIAPYGTAVLAATAYSRNIMLLLVASTMGAVGVATQVTVSQAQGRGDVREADALMTRSLLRAVPTMFLVLALLAATSSMGGGIVGHLFTDDPAILAPAAAILWVAVAGETAKSMNQILLPSLRGSSDVLVPVSFGVLSHWGIGIGLAWTMSVPLGLGFVGVLLGAACDDALRALFNLFRWRSGTWKRSLSNAGATP